jgi:hypothetical protein
MYAMYRRYLMLLKCRKASGNFNSTVFTVEPHFVPMGQSLPITDDIFNNILFLRDDCRNWFPICVGLHKKTSPTEAGEVMQSTNV